MKTLLVAEKKSAAEDFAKGLEIYGSFKTIGRSFESDKYIITWLQGHVVSMKETRDYPNWGGKWDLAVLPWYPPNMNFEYKVTDYTKRVFEMVSPVMKRSDIELIISATDAGREGDLIFWEMYDYLKLKTPVKRFFESAVLTPANIQRIMSTDLKGPDFFEPRKDAAYGRAYADLLLGMNFTIGFTAKAGTLLNLGRVKTPTLAILANRRNEIDNFKEDFYFELEADFGGVYKGLWFKDQLGNTQFEKTEDIEAMMSKINSKTGKIIKKETKEHNERHPLLYSLTSLQRDASKKFNFDPNQTLEIAQSLYDVHKILSYPRSDSEVIGTAHVPQLESILNAVNVVPYATHAQFALDAGIPTSKRLVNDKKLTDHHALMPTNITPDLSKLNPNERKIYDLVVKRFLSVFYPDALYEKTSVITEVENETFKTSGRIEIDKGWKVVYDGLEVEEKETETEEENENVLPPIAEGEERLVVDIIKHDKKTSPPKLYNFDMLLAAMEKPKKFLSSKELQDILDETEAGLGTPATRANILDELISGGYVQKIRKNLDVTELGRKLIEICPEGLKSPIITAEWENKLMQMSHGKHDLNDFLSEIQDYIEENLEVLRNATLTVNFASERGGNGEEVSTCPHCKFPIRDKGSVYACDSSSKEVPCFILSKEIGKKKISETMVKELAEKGQTKEIKGFVGGSGKKFNASLKIDGKKVTFDFPETVVIAECPHCSKSISDRGTIYVCESNTKEEPCFIVGKQIAKKTIPVSAVKQLAEKGATVLIKGFTGSSGKPFDAMLKLDGKKVVFAFEDRPKVESQTLSSLCPFCKKGTVKGNAKAFGCSNWSEGCKFTVWKNGTVITEKVVEQLILKGETDIIEGMTGKNGSSFKAKLKLNFGTQKVDMEFK